jgi:hypothetical protein
MLLSTVQQALKNIVRQQPDSAAWAAKAFQESAKKTRSAELKRRELIKKEAEIGAKVFGPVPAGHRRQFFCMDAHTWVWHEEWLDIETKRKVSQHVRYEIRPGSITKSVNSGTPVALSQEEAENLVQAAVLYHQYVSTVLYGKTLGSSASPEMPAGGSLDS